MNVEFYEPTFAYIFIPSTVSATLDSKFYLLNKKENETLGKS